MIQPNIFVIAGEASGDFIGSCLIKSIKEKNPRVNIYGVGGPLMIDQDVESLFPMDELSIMGISEILLHIPHLKKRIHETADFIIHHNIDVLITIDAPEFCHRVSKKVKKIKPSVKVIHYVAPSVWAWRKKRAKKISKYVDHLLTLFSFEPSYFENYVKTTFVGHPLVENHDHCCELSSLHLPTQYSNRTCIVVLPGSRCSEIRRLLPIFAQVCKFYYDKFPNTFFWIPTFDKFSKKVAEVFQDFNLPFYITTSSQEKWMAFQKARIAIAASGTVSLELAQKHLPSIIAYRVSILTYVFVKMLIKVKFVSLVNIILGKQIFPEFLQSHCTPKKIFSSMLCIQENEASIKSQLSGVAEKLRPNSFETPSAYAADIVLSYLN